VLGPAAAAARPTVVQLVVPRPGRISEGAFEGALVRARRRMERTARSEGIEDFAVASASARTVVYKGLVAGHRLAELYPDLARRWPASLAVFHQRYATNTMPTWSLAQPFRWLAHNGEINTVRGNREQVRGRSRDQARSAAARRLKAAGPLISPGGSDSASPTRRSSSLSRRLVARGRAPALRSRRARPAAGPRGPAASGTDERAQPLAPWDGPAAIVFSDGRRVGGILDRNGLRPLAFVVTDDRLVAMASEAGAFDLPAGSIVRRGRLGPGEMLVVEPMAGRIHLPSDDEPTIAVPEASGLAAASHARFLDRERWNAGAHPPPLATMSADLRFLVGLDAERYRLDIRTMVVEGHEPLWSMGDDTPTPARARTDRPVSDHLRQAFAQVTNPPIDAERERAAVDCHVELGPRASILGGPRTPSSLRRLRLERPFVADLEGLLSAAPVRVRRLDATWSASDGAHGLEAALDRLAARAVASARRGIGLVVVSDTGFSRERLPSRPCLRSVLSTRH
jgi:hypothetical protein